MKFSTRGRYGLHAMFDLAQHYGEGPVAIKDVASRQDISEHYLEQLMGSLRKAGLIQSIRGAQGGYILSRKPDEITVGDVIRVLEGPINPAECLGDEQEYPCNQKGSCVVRGVWQKIKNSVDEVLDSITLDQLCKEAESHKRSLMYYI